MGGPRRLLHQRKEIPKASRKKLFFGVLLAVPLLSSCVIAQASPLPKSKNVYAQKECKPDIRKLLEPGEKIIESICRPNRDFVLTNANLYIFRKHDKTEGDITLVSSCSIRDLEDTMGNGLVGWAASDDTAFILTHDRTLTLVPAALRGDTLPAYRIPFNVENAKIMFHAGKLFIAGKEQLMVATFSGKVKSKTYSFFLKTKDRNFFESQGRLFFGNQKEKIEIRITREKVELR